MVINVIWFLVYRFSSFCFHFCLRIWSVLNPCQVIRRNVLTCCLTRHWTLLRSRISCPFSSTCWPYEMTSTLGTITWVCSVIATVRVNSLCVIFVNRLVKGFFPIISEINLFPSLVIVGGLSYCTAELSEYISVIQWSPWSYNAASLGCRDI